MSRSHPDAADRLVLIAEQQMKLAEEIRAAVAELRSQMEQTGDDGADAQEADSGPPLGEGGQARAT